MMMMIVVVMVVMMLMQGQGKDKQLTLPIEWDVAALHVSILGMRHDLRVSLCLRGDRTELAFVQNLG